MSTTMNIPSRRMSNAGYETILNHRYEREAQEQAAQEAQERQTLEENMKSSQRNINVLCKSIQSSYSAMVNEAKEMRQCQDELSEKLKEEELFHATSDEVYSYKEVNESISPKMSFLRIAYYLLPALDCFFAYFALYPIVTSKSADLDSVLSGFAVIIGAVLSIAVGLGLSLISRMGVAALEANDESEAKKRVKKWAMRGAVICLPLMYIIGEIAFNAGTQWTYSACFAFVSLVIQLLIVSGYKSQTEAIAYFREKEKKEGVKRIKETDENAIRKEILSIREKIQRINVSFQQDYNNFTNQFWNLAAARDEHIQAFGKDAHYYLNQMVIYIGNLVCFRRIVIPLHEENGAVAAMPFVDFPHVLGGQDIFMNNDFIYIDYMMQRSQTGITLSETLRLIEEQRQSGLNTVATGAEDPVSSETLGNASSPDENSDDEQSDTGVIW